MDAPSGSRESNRKDWFLYVVSEFRMFRLHLDVDRLSNKDCIPPGEYDDPFVPLETIHLVSPYARTPMFMTQMIDEEFKTWLVGGFVADIPPIPNLKFGYLVDPTKPSISFEFIIDHLPYLTPYMLNALTNQHVHTYQFGSSLYVLDLTDSHKMIFYVAESKTSRVLPNPPLSVPYQVVNQSRWANKIHIHVRPTVSRIPYLTYTLDLSTKTWVGGMDQVLAAVEYKSFLIALLASGIMVSYGRDSYGYPTIAQNALYHMFDICMLSWLLQFDAEKAFMGLFDDDDDDFIWLAYKVRDSPHMLFVLFRVSINMDSDGNPVLSVIVEASHQYDDVDTYLCNAFTCST